MGHPEASNDAGDRDGCGLRRCNRWISPAKYDDVLKSRSCLRSAVHGRRLRLWPASAVPAIVVTVIPESSALRVDWEQAFHLDVDRWAQRVESFGIHSVGRGKRLPSTQYLQTGAICDPSARMYNEKAGAPPTIGRRQMDEEAVRTSHGSLSARLSPDRAAKPLSIVELAPSQRHPR